MKKLLKLGWIAYFIILGSAFFTYIRYPNPKWIYEPSQVLTYSINLIPFKNIIYYGLGLLHNLINRDIALNYFIRNIFIGMPLGILIPMTLQKWNLKQILQLSFIIHFSIELIAFSLQIGIVDIDSLILRLLGALFTYVILKRHIAYNESVKIIMK